jgi:hypothetical protein
LEAIHASGIGIAYRREQLEVSWKTGDHLDEKRFFESVEVEALRVSARMLRGLVGGAPQLGLQEQLRTLGRDLDERDAEWVVMTETTDGFWVTALVNGVDFRRMYPREELIAQAHELHRARLPAGDNP